ncbi:MAG: imidazole glycerol phosphate synthase subunit HisH [Nostocoides sp.]
MRSVVVLDYGFGNVRSVVRALERVGAAVTLTADPQAALNADGLVVPGVGNFHACMAGLNAVQGPRVIGRRLAGSRPVLGICVGLQVMFDGSTEPANEPLPGLGQWPGMVARLDSPVIPHMGWSTVDCATSSTLFAGIQAERFYFVHSYAASDLVIEPSSAAFAAVTPKVSYTTYGQRFVAAVENGPLSATQFHPEKSADTGLALLRNWVGTL